MSEDQIESQVTAVKPRKPRSRRAEPQGEPEHISLMIPTDDQEDYEIISLHDNEDIPPPGQFFGVNGRAFNLRSNTWYKVPAWLLSTVDNCVIERPVKDEHLRLVGTRQMKRFPYEVYRG